VVSVVTLRLPVSVVTLGFLQVAGTALASRFLWIQTAFLGMVALIVYAIGVTSGCFNDLVRLTEIFLSLNHSHRSELCT
jgi:hypothetical protein